MSQYKLMRGIILSALGLALSAGFFIPFQMTHAAVLYEQSQTGTAYDIFADVGTNTGFYTKLPQYSGSGVVFTGGGVAYTGTAAWLRLKRLSGLSCDAPLSISLYSTDGNTQIGTIFNSSGVATGDYCDFPITGNNRTDQTLGFISICLNGDCDGLTDSFVLDGSPENEGYIVDGTQTIFQPGGWAFQICDDGGCEGGFELATTTATSTATSTDTGTGTTTATSTATSTPPTATSTGASSVLFLPGIQASRLYLGDGNQVFNRIWEPTNNIDVRTLGLSEQGTTNVDIRTDDVIDETSVEILGQNIYKGFMGFLDDLVDEQIISEWTPFAYDWRYDVFDIAGNGTKYLDGSIQNPVDEVIRLASSSLSKKVTIVAHSNGGLLAKAIMYELEKRGKSNFVDNIVFIGTPHLGTPKAIGTILHGYDQEALGGLIIDDGIARSIIKNLPGAYSLLPSEKYFEVSDEPVIRFDNSSTTAALRNGYGSMINTAGAFNAFMVGLADTTGRSNVTEAEINRPTLANSDMYFAAQEKHKQMLDNWTSTNELKVFQVAGTGLPTVKAVEYREVIETVCLPNATTFLLCSKEKLLKPHVRYTLYGDQTVVSESASYSKEESANNYYLDLDAVREGIFNLEKTHENLTEASQIQDFLQQIITTGSSSNIEFISIDQPNFTKTYDIEEINSPVQISAKDFSGRITGVVKEGNQLLRKQDIPGSLYLEFGGTKYLIIPSETKRTTTLIGEALGGYTLTISNLSSDGAQTIKHEIVNATTTSSMVATYSKSTTSYSSVRTDYNSDGVIDYVNTVDGVYVPLVYDYLMLKNSIANLPIKKSFRDVLIKLAAEAEKLSLKSNQKFYDPLEKLTLRALEVTVQLYQKQGIITKTQNDDLIKIIKFLSK